MDLKNDKILIFHNNVFDIIDEMKANFADHQIESGRIVVKQLNSSEFDPQLISDEELVQFKSIAIIGASIKSVKEMNERIRKLDNTLKLIIADMSESFIYVFVDFGLNDLTIDKYLQTFGDSISDKLAKTGDASTCFKPLLSMISGIICGQLMARSLQSPQLFSYEMNSEVLNFSFESNTSPIVVIGCGSLGFELVKNLVRIGAKNLILVDNDIVHKYNIKCNYFNERDVGLKKCEVVKEYATKVRADVAVETHYAKVQQASSHFFESIAQTNGIIVTAVDNTGTKRFINKVCLIHSIPFIDVGVDCGLFHIQPIVPHLTESYFSYSDPSDMEYPLCVIKSFPQIIEQCVEWSKMKFDNWFNKKPKLLGDWNHCLKSSRLLFQKCFNHKAKQLLFSIPSDHINEDGSNFWADKKIPHSVEFDLNNELHLLFVKSCAHLMSTVNNIIVTEEQLKDSFIIDVIKVITIPEFIPKHNKVINTDPSVTAPNEDTEHDLNTNKDLNDLKRQTYSKEDDIQLNLIYALSNLRASMYGIDMISISEVRRISHKIIYCFGSTLSTASSMTSIEVIKLLIMNGKYMTCEQNNFHNRNHFCNLADFDLFVTSEAGKPTKTQLSSSIHFTEWDYWLITESENLSTLEEVLNDLKERSGSVCTMLVMDDTKSVYLPELFPHHIKRKKQTMRDLIGNYYRVMPKFVTLTVSFENEFDDIPGPNVKYILSDTS